MATHREVVQRYMFMVSKTLQCDACNLESDDVWRSFVVIDLDLLFVVLHGVSLDVVIRGVRMKGLKGGTGWGRGRVR